MTTARGRPLRRWKQYKPDRHPDGPAGRPARCLAKAAELNKGQKQPRHGGAGRKRVPLPHPEIFKAAKPGGMLLIDDGKVRLRIVAHDAKTIDTEVEVAGAISDRKGVNLPNLVLPLSPMTPKDRKDLDYGLSLGVDWVALSFVQHANDIAELRLVAGRAAVMAKLEKPVIIDHLDEIIEQSDGIGGARRSRRGDAARGGAALAEAHPRREPDRRQAGHRRHADARFDGPFADADARRGVRRGDRGL
jgi:hypothetical protein